MIDKKHLGNLYVPKDKVQDLLNWRANVEKHIYDPAIGEEVVREDRFIETKTKRFTYYGLYTMQNYHWHPNGEKRSNLCGLRFLKCVDGCLVISSITSWGCNYLYDLIVKGIVKQFDRDYTYIDYAKTLEDFGISITDNEVENALATNARLTIVDKVMDTQERLIQSVSSAEIEVLNRIHCWQVKKLKKDMTALDILKKALTITHIPYPKIEIKENDGRLDLFVQKLYEIKQNELDIDLRQNLRDWVLKNACPLEYKALKEIITLYNDWLANQKSDFEFFTLFNEIVCKYALKEVIEK